MSPMNFCPECGHVHKFKWRCTVNGEPAKVQITPDGVAFAPRGRSTEVGDSFVWELLPVHPRHSCGGVNQGWPK